METEKYSAKDIKIMKLDDEFYSKVDISKEGFKKNLILASKETVEFTRTLVYNKLPENIRYKIYLNCSYDENLEKGEKTFSEDLKNRSRKINEPDEIVKLLWRNGLVPEWINVTVYDVDDNFTYLMLECCGRFSSKPKQMYHIHEGKAPFHILGPPMPFDTKFDENDKIIEKYDLYWNKK